MELISTIDKDKEIIEILNDNLSALIRNIAEMENQKDQIERGLKVSIQRKDLIKQILNEMRGN